MVESCIVIVFLCLLFLGLFQLAHAYVARDVLHHSAARAARAKTVGFNQWMVEKTLRVAAIPNAGPLLQPVVPPGDPALTAALASLGPGDLWDFALRATPRAPSLNDELRAIPDYLASVNRAQGGQVLDYRDWGTIRYAISTGAGAVSGSGAADLITARVWQPHDLLVPLAPLAAGDLNAFANAPSNSLTLIGRYEIENHYPLYLDDQYW